MMKSNMSREALLHEISKIDFAIVEMTLYLDTHPYEKGAIEFLKHHVKMKKQLEKEYNYMYEPLTIRGTVDSDDNKWLWALAPMPWKGGCK